MSRHDLEVAARDVGERVVAELLADGAADLAPLGGTNDHVHRIDPSRSASRSPAGACSCRAVARGATRSPPTCAPRVPRRSWPPMINFAPTDDAPALEAALADLAAGEFDWMTVTSATTVDVLSAQRAVVPASTRVAAVGETTAAALVAAGYKVDLVPSEDNSARGLLEEWETATAGVVPLRVLTLRSEIAQAAPDRGSQAHRPRGRVGRRLPHDRRPRARAASSSDVADGLVQADPRHQRFGRRAGAEPARPASPRAPSSSASARRPPATPEPSASASTSSPRSAPPPRSSTPSSKPPPPTNPGPALPSHSHPTSPPHRSHPPAPVRRVGDSGPCRPKSSVPSDTSPARRPKSPTPAAAWEPVQDAHRGARRLVR